MPRFKDVDWNVTPDMNNIVTLEQAQLSVPIKVGDTVRVPSVQGHISVLKRSGMVIAISGELCKVLITVADKKGHWTGKISEVEKCK